MASTSREYWKDISRIFGLPENTKKATIILEIDKAAVAECVVLVDAANSDKTETKRYKLVEIDGK